MAMQKIMNQIKWGLLIFLVVSLPTDVLFAQSVTVTGCGVDQQNALRDAMRLAVERVVGALISSETSVKDLTVLEDNIYAKSQGYVNSYRILRTEQRGEDTFVTAEVDVSSEPGSELMKTLDVLQLLDDPRIVVLIQEQNSNGYQESKICESAIMQSLLDAGFKRVVDARQALAQSGKIIQTENFAKDMESLASLAKETGADYLIVGSANVGASEELSQMFQYKTPTGMRSFQGVLDARLFRADTGIVVAATSTKGVALELTDMQGMQSALLEASQEMAKFFLDKLKSYAGMAVKNVQVSVRINGYAQVEALKRAISRISGVNGVYLRTYQDGTALLDVDYGKSAQNLWNDLKRSMDVNVTLQSLTENGLNLVIE